MKVRLLNLRKTTNHFYNVIMSLIIFVHDFNVMQHPQKISFDLKTFYKICLHVVFSVEENNCSAIKRECRKNVTVDGKTS